MKMDTHTPQPGTTHVAVTTAFSDGTHASRQPCNYFSSSDLERSVSPCRLQHSRFLLPTTYGTGG
jgi:hypothetical protein